MSTYQYLLMLTFVINFTSLCSEFTEFEITQANYNQYLRLDTPDQQSFQLSSDDLKRVQDIVSLTQKTQNFKTTIPQDPLSKSSIYFAPFGGLCAGGAFYALRQTTRMPLDPALLIAAAAGGTLVAGGLYWFRGKEMGIIRSFRSDLQRALQELDTMQKLVNQLKASNENFESRIDETLLITQELKDALPQVIKISGDNANLATILGTALKEIRGQQILLTQLLARLPEHERIAMIAQAQEAIPKTIERQAHAIIEYNQHSLRRRLGFGAVTEFEQIPPQWLNEHGFNDLIATE
ncbi:MAG: hypothetical protein EBU90_14530 [Proteobacteria bacterium]|nr:hypothetical protein [Pseudomonadota bacterium]NBP15190.1 hypothetical protein [bacterium]